MTRDFKKDFDRLIEQIDSNEAILPENKNAIHSYINKSKSQDLNVKTKIKHLYGLRKFLEAMDKHVVLKDATKEDIEKAVANINDLELSHEVKRGIKVTIKSFYRQCFGEGEEYPKSVRWIKTSIKRTERLLPEDILNEEDVEKMINTANNPRDKAIIALLFDSGIRPSELLSLRKKDCELETGRVKHILVKGKTGMRQIPIHFSVPYLAQYLNIVKDLKQNEPLWWNLSQSNIKGQLEDGGLRKMIAEVAEASGVAKKVYPYLFRHSRATFYASKLKEAELRSFFGWTRASTMVATYVHLSGRDIDNAVLIANGLKPQDSIKESKLKVKECETCKMINSLDSIYCTRCGSALDIRTAIDKEKNTKSMKELVIEALKDPEIMNEVSKSLARSNNQK